jgi:hypothetical protein
MDEAGAMHDLQRRGGGIGQRRVVVAAGNGHRHQDGRPDARTARRHRIVERGGEFGRRGLCLRRLDLGRYGAFDPVLQSHRTPPGL